MKRCSFYIAIFFAILLAGCSDEPADQFEIFTQSFDFNASNYDWQPGFADYPAGPDDSVFYELRYEYGDFKGAKSVMLSGNNHSDDLFMFIKKKLTGLEPNRQYTVTFEVEFASNAQEGSVGIGGSPGESVFLKVGATSIEPKSVIEKQMYVMNIDKGVQSESGADMITVGNIAVPSTGDDQYYIITRSNSSAYDYATPLIATTNSKGELWLIVGTDSGFEGITTIYYTRISAVFSIAK